MAKYKKNTTGHIKINDRYTIHPYSYGWVLLETVKYKDKTGKVKTRVNELFYSKLRVLFPTLVDLSTQEAESLRDVVDRVEQVKLDILEALDKIEC